VISKNSNITLLEERERERERERKVIEMNELEWAAIPRYCTDWRSNLLGSVIITYPTV